MAKEAWMIVIYGPNGAGKSTFYDSVLKNDPFFKKADFVNLDIEAARLAGENGNPDDVMFEAGRNIYGKLDEKLKKHETFIYETTSSGRAHLRLIEKARNQNFKVASIFIGLSSVTLSMLRVKARVNNGGHNVPPDVIERRFPNILKNFPDMLKVSDISLAFDNSKKTPYELIFMMDERKLLVFHTYPQWMKTALKGRKTHKEVVHITKEEFSQMSPKKIAGITNKVFKLLNSDSK